MIHLRLKKIVNNKKINIIIFSLLIMFVTLFIYKFYDSTKWILLVGIIGFIINTARLKFDEPITKLYNLVIKYRYIVALCVFLFCLVFKLHGSSVGVFNTLFPDKIDPAISDHVVGKARLLRSDEYNVQLPYYFSQYYNDYNLDSHQMSIAGQDMIIGYNAPVKDITMIAKPFTIGYLLFGNERGLSWYWCSKLILFILVSFEFMYIITHKNKKLSILGSFLIVFSPAMQWWFSPHMYDVFFWATSLYVLGYYFFTAREKWFKWLITILSACGLIGFVIALFPSLQVALGLIAFILLIVTLVRDRDKITFRFDKLNTLRVFIVVLIVGGILIRYGIGSLDQIKLLSSTVYPGHRISTGGGESFEILFFDLANLLSPYWDVSFLNNCEISRFFHLGVLFVFYFPFIFYQWKKHAFKKSYNISIGIILLIMLLIEAVFLIIGFPEWLAKITLFSYINRMNLVYSYTALLFTLWSFDTILKNKELQNIKYGLICLILFALLYYKSIPPNHFDYIRTITSVSWAPKGYHIGLILLCAIIGLSILFGNKQLYISILISLSIFSTWTINPITKGISAINNEAIYPVIQNIVKKDDSYWLSVGTSFEQNYLIASGAKCLNAVNFYPDYGKWKAVDPKLKNDEFYNRYIHMAIALTDDKTSYQLSAPDSIVVNMNVNDLKKWNVKYLLSAVDISDQLKSGRFKFNIIKGDSKYSIYKLNY